jgi:hypothetical protein
MDNSDRGNRNDDRSADDKEARQEKVGLYVLAALVIIFSAIGFYRIEKDDGPLEILGLCGAMPTLFGFLLLVGMHMTWLY